MSRALSVSAAALVAALSVGCVTGTDAPKAPEARWSPPPEAIPRAPKPAPPPADMTPSALANRTISLHEAIDVALKNSPVTRQSWLLTQSAAADVGSRRSAWYPSVQADFSALRQQQSSQGGAVSSLSTTYAGSASLTWLLLDLGGRGADVEEAKRRLWAADFSHNATMNDLMLAVAQSYYLYQGARALLVAQDASLKQAQENYAAAEERHAAGVATIADVLQARTVLSQQKLAYDQVSGQIQTLRGQLATALGAPVDLPVDAAELPEDVGENVSVAAVDRLIASAEQNRPDLAAARVRAQAAHARVTSVRSAGLPTLSASALGGRSYYDFLGEAVPYSPAWSIGLFLHVPLFRGFKTVYDTKSAEAQARAADAGAESYAQQVVFQVWNSSFGVQTAAQQVRASKDLLASARESAEVARGRYREGVGSILDLLTAESAYASALALDVRSRAGFLLAMAQLAHDAGTLDPALIPGTPRKDTP
ncbi:MAG: TolC family protein [Acidobacteriota bacterium]|nr:TolC family protein [Acidobacteriota bacterium]